MGFFQYFEDFQKGATYRHRPGRTLTESDDSFFSLLTMNHNPLCIDRGLGPQGPQVQHPVAGPLVFSTAVGLSVPDFKGASIASLGYDEIRQLAPVFHGDTIFAETTVLELKELQSRPDRGIVQVETTVRNQRDEVVLTFRRQVLVPRKGRTAEDHLK